MSFLMVTLAVLLGNGGGVEVALHAASNPAHSPLHAIRNEGRAYCRTVNVRIQRHARFVVIIIVTMFCY